jgi:Domain of unknown function (DUF5076)
MVDTKQLAVPEVARRDPNSFELLRVWIANEGQHVSLRAGVWDDPAAWGLMLADLARHVANAYREEAALDGPATLRRIKDAIAVELDSPTDEASTQRLDSREPSKRPVTER